MGMILMTVWTWFKIISADTDTMFVGVLFLFLTLLFIFYVALLIWSIRLLKIRNDLTTDTLVHNIVVFSLNIIPLIVIYKLNG